MPTRRAPLVVAFLCAVAQAACSADAATGPDAESPAYDDAAYAEAQFAAAPVESPAAVSTAGDTTVTVMRVDPTRAMAFAVRPDHRIFFPAKTICDPATSGYGPAEWDRECAALTTTIEVTARAYTTAAGYARVDFSPALRFWRKGNHSVTLWLKDRSGDRAAFFTVLHCPDAPAGTAAPCVDESVGNRKLATHADRKRGLLFGRLEHFNGYMVGVGRDEGDAY